MFGRSAAAVVLKEGNTGGGFGIRGELYPEDVLVALAALRLGRPVKWIEDRREHLMAANHSRQQCHRVRAAVDHEGRILGLDAELFHDQGAYLPTQVPRVAGGEAVGAGLAIFVEKSGLGPTDRVTISVDNEGFVELVTGGASVGQGFETVMAQIAADAMSVDYRRVRVVHGHTDRIEHGVG